MYEQTPNTIWTNYLTPEDPDNPRRTLEADMPIHQILARKMEHEGVLYGLSKTPKPKEKEFPPPWQSRSKVFNDMLKEKIAARAIGKYLECEVNKSIAKMEAEIEEKGVDAILPYFKENGL
jgi:hypothetical protein